MSENYQFDKPLKLMILCLQMSGIKMNHVQWHPILETFVNSLLFYVNLIILYTVIFGEIYFLVYGIQIGRDFVELSLTAPCITISILSTLKLMPIYFKRDIVCQIMDTLKDIHPNVTNDKEKEEEENLSNEESGNSENAEKEMTETQLAIDSVNRLKFVETFISVLSVLVLIAFLLAPLVLIYLKYYETGEVKIKYPFSVKYWFDIYETKLWLLVYFHQGWATVIVCINIFGTEVLFYSVCTYIEMHFLILCHRFESIQSGPSREIQKELMANVQKHHLLINLVEQTEALFSQPILVHIVTSSFLICLSAFNISVAKEISSAFAFMTFLLLSLSQVSLLCFFGDKLMKSSAEVSGAIYKCPWYDFDVTVKKAVLIIIMRAQKPCKLSAANFADVNLRAFTTILSRSWSYFALLKTVYN